VAVEGMVHALQEAHRVLRSGGVLVDLRPAPVHRRVGVFHAGEVHVLASMREDLEPDRQATRALARAIEGGLFRRDWSTRFECRRWMDSIGDLRKFLDEFPRLGQPLPPHEPLVRRVKRELAQRRGAPKLVVVGPLQMAVLQKVAEERALMRPGRETGD
jgi:SAM-dependent methyltransferase